MGVRIAVVLGLMALSGVCLRADLKTAMAEPNLEKRSKIALEAATAALEAARADYAKGDNEKVAADMADLQTCVDLAYKSLQDTGKNPRKSPKWFKYAEIRTRDLVRKLETLEQEMSFAERPPVTKAQADVQEVHDHLLVGLMEGKVR